METLYRKVLCSKRPPNKEKHYLTNMGWDYFHDDGERKGFDSSEVKWWLEELQPQEQWISVDDRLPDEPDNAGGFIPILIVGDGIVYEANYEGGGDFCTSMYSNYPTVTHWMHLPDPPKTEE